MLNTLTKRVLFIFILILFFISCNTALTGAKNKKANTKLQVFELLFFEANQAKLNNNTDKAIDLYDKCIELNPDDPTSYYEASKLLHRKNKHSEALPYIEKAYSLDEENPWIREEYAKSLFATKQLDKSLKIYTKLIEDNPKDPELYFNVFNIHVIKKEYKEAIKSISKMENIIGMNEKTVKEKQLLYLKLNDVKGATKVVQELINKYPNNANYKLMLARIYLANEKEDDAINVFQSIIKKDSSNIPSHLFLYEYFNKKHLKKQKDKELNTIITLKEVKVKIKIQLILDEILALKKDSTLITNKEKILKLCEKLISEHPKFPESYMLIGDYYSAIGNNKKALLNYRKALELEPNNLKGWQQLVIMGVELKDTLGVIKNSSEAIELFPSQPLFYYLKSLAFQMQKKYSDALTPLEIGVDFTQIGSPLEMQMKTNMADCYYNLKKLDQAFKMFENLLEKNADNTYLLNNYSYYLSLEKRDLDKAKKMSKKSIELSPNEYNYYDTYAWVLYQKEEFSEALKWINKAIKKGGGDSVVILEHKGDILFKLNENSLAIKLWKEAKRKGNGSDFLERKVKDGTLYE